MMVLKGYACSLDWPQPAHRSLGDMDIRLFGRSREADRILKQEKGIQADRSDHHYCRIPLSYNERESIEKR